MTFRESAPGLTIESADVVPAALTTDEEPETPALAEDETAEGVRPVPEEAFAPLPSKGEDPVRLYLKEIGMVIAPLPFTTRSGGASLEGKVPFEELFSISPFVKKQGLRYITLKPEKLTGSGYTKAVSSGSKSVSYKNFPGISEKIEKIIEF